MCIRDRYMYANMTENFARDLEDFDTAQGMVPDLLEAAAEGDVRARKSALSALTSMATNLGNALEGLHAIVVPSIGQLVFDTQVARQARLAVAAFAPSVSQQIFDDLGTQIMAKLGASAANAREIEAKTASAETFVALIGPCGGRLRPLVPRFMEILLADVNSGKDINWDEPETYYDLLSIQLAAVAGLLEKCPADLEPFTDALLEAIMSTDWESEWNAGLLGLGSMADAGGGYYSDDSVDWDDDNWSDDGGAGGDAEYEPNESDYVRAGAFKVVIALVKSRPDLLGFMLSDVAPTTCKLIASEPSESVKQIFLKSMGTLARQVKRIEKESAGELTASLEAMVNDLLPTVCGFAKGTGRISSDKSTTVDGLFRMLTELGHTAGWDHFGKNLNVIIPSMDYVLSNDGATSAARVRCLVFVRELAENSESLGDAEQVVGLLIKSIPVGFNVARTALEASGAIAKFVTNEALEPLHAAVHTMFMQDAIDGDIKHAAIVAMGKVLVAGQPHTSQQALDETQVRLASQLNNEVTRAGAVVVIGMLASAGADVSSVLISSLQKVLDLTRQADSFIRQQALVTLKQVAANSKLSDNQMEQFMQGLGDKVRGNELKDVELAVQALTALVNAKGAGCAHQIQDKLMDSVCGCLRSDGFQGAAVDATLEFLEALVLNSCDPSRLIEDLIRAINAPAKLTKTNSGLTRVASSGGGQGLGATGNIARAVGVVCKAAGAATGNKAIVDLMKLGKSVFVLQAIGEVAVNSVGEVAGLQELVTASLKEGGEDELYAAAFTVGCLCVGNSDKYIPFVVDQLHSGAVNKVVMLTAVKEAITRCIHLGKTDLLLPHVQTSILPLLVSLASSKMEATRSKVQDCLGKLLKMAPAQVMDAISSTSSGGDPLSRASAFGSIRFYSSKNEDINAMIVPRAIELVMSGVQDSEPDVRLAALRATESLLPKPKYFRACETAVLQPLLNGILGETSYVNITEEQLGNMTIKTDMGLPNREAAFKCLCTALEHLEDKFSLSELMGVAVAGCADSAGVAVRSAALKIVQTLAASSTSMLSEHILGLKDAILAAFKDAYSIRKESEDDFTTLKQFVMGLRDLFDSFKLADPTNAVFDAVEAGLSKQDTEYGKSKIPAKRELSSMVAEYRGQAVEAEAAPAEQ
eukprot:TRINITY_DN4605_c0_g1_i15.p1 TRINITY_DN4605_c0_g1~~TRINITY_DN4605_c0_g1_i15.p1  ORF type:complete len:1154 (-),score=271.78 TRINITY_DN4605_c0_g1_i15:441-3902(-)